MAWQMQPQMQQMPQMQAMQQPMQQMHNQQMQHQQNQQHQQHQQMQQQQQRQQMQQQQQRPQMQHQQHQQHQQMQHQQMQQPQMQHEQMQASRGMGQAGKGSKGKDGKGMRPPAHQVRPQSLALSPSASAPSAQGIMVSGCANETVSNIIKGSFSVAGSNHGKHIYKKDTSDPNVTVLIYYWDDRDGSSFSGWWIGPKVGGDQVWSHADNRSSPTPPPAGWHVPWDGPVDPSLTLTYTPATASAAPPPALPAPAPQPGKAAGKAAGKAVGKGQVVGVRPVMKPHDLQMERKKPETIGPGGPQNNRIEELRRKSAEAEEAQRKRQEEMKRNREEDLQRRKEMTAATNVRKVLAKVRAARADSYDALRAQLEESIATNLEAMGSIASKVGQEAEEVLQAAQTRIDDLNEQRAQEDRERAEQEKQRKHEAENSVKFVEEAKSDAQTQLKKVQEAEELCKKLEDEADPTKLLERTEAAEKEVASVLGEANEVKAAIHEKQRRMLTDGNSKIRRELSEVMGKLGAALRSLNAVLHGLKSRREKVARKAAAVEKMNEKKSVFAQFDLDKDGKLSKKEVEAYMKATINFDLPPAILDPIVQKLDPITYAKFRSLHQRLYIAKSELLAREAKNYSILGLGFASLHNHAEDPNTDFAWEQRREHGRRLVGRFWTLRPVQTGEELLISYGSSWFTSRNLTAKSS